MEHTIEPWIVECGDENADWAHQFPTIHSGDIEVIGTEGFYSELGNDKENARRVVACINACAGIPTDHLELCGEDFLGHYTEMREVEKLVFQRDELLKAMKKLSGMKLNMIADNIVDKAISENKG